MSRSAIGPTWYLYVISMPAGNESQINSHIQRQERDCIDISVVVVMGLWLQFKKNGGLSSPTFLPFENSDRILVGKNRCRLANTLSVLRFGTLGSQLVGSALVQACLTLFSKLWVGLE